MLHVPPVLLGHTGQLHLAKLLASDMPTRSAVRTAQIPANCPGQSRAPGHAMPVPVFVQYLDVYLYWLVYVFVFYIRLVPFPT